jgi:hypothetical protein
MSDKVRLACGPEVVMVPLDKILPMRLLDEGVYKAATRTTTRSAA